MIQPVANDKALAGKALQKEVYPKDTLGDARMIPYYEKQLERRNLDPVIRSYYERRLSQALKAKESM